MLLGQELKKSDAIFVLGSIDERVPEYAAELFAQRLGKWMIISGGQAHGDDLLATNWEEGTEAEHFAEIVKPLGVPEDRLILETKAQNTGDNAEFIYNEIQLRDLAIDSFIVVQKPYMERRAYATFMKQWKGSKNFTITSPPLDYDNYFDAANDKEQVINIMVGDLQRIKEYPKLGFQIEQDIPDEVWMAWEQLVELGFDKHLMRS